MLEPIVAPLRAIALRVYPQSPGLRVLDLGCGTGAHLERYLEAGCVVAGVDTSEAMLARARLRLGDRADLRHGDAAHLPFPDASFDLVTATLMLHELTEETRDAVVREVLRVLAPDGRLLVTDFHTGPAAATEEGMAVACLRRSAPRCRLAPQPVVGLPPCGRRAGDGGAARAGRRTGEGGLPPATSAFTCCVNPSL